MFWRRIIALRKEGGGTKGAGWGASWKVSTAGLMDKAAVAAVAGRKPGLESRRIKK